MQELIARIAANSNISIEQAEQALETITDYIKEKYPLLAGTVDSVTGKKSSGKYSQLK